MSDDELARWFLIVWIVLMAGVIGVLYWAGWFAA